MGQNESMSESITTKRAIICARVSSESQAKEGRSIPTQLAEMRDYARREGFTVTAEIADTISGATPMRQRIGGTQIYEHIEHKTVDCVIFYTTDRVSRGSLPKDVVDLMDACATAGIELHLKDFGRIDLNDPFQVILVLMRWAGAADERRKINERTMRGIRQKARDGQMVGAGGPRYGYRFEGEKPHRQFVIDESQADVIRLIFRWFLQGDSATPLSKPMTLWKIAVRLTTMGVPTPSTRNNRPRKVAGQWSRTSLFEILRDETYTGIARYGKVSTTGNQRTERPQDEQIQIIVPTIIDRETWDKAQARLKHNKANATRNARRVYVLRGLITCGKCGSKFGGNVIKDTHRYVCTQFAKVLNHPELKCRQPSVHGPWLDSEAWRYVLDIITDETKFKDALQLAQQDDTADKQPAIDELEIIDRLIAEKQQESDNLSERAKHVKAGGLVAQSLQVQMDAVDDAYAELTKKRSELQSKIEQKPITDSDVERALEARRALFESDLQVGMENPTPEAQRALFELFNLRVTVTDRSATLSCRLTAEHKTVDFRTRSGTGRTTSQYPLAK